MSLFLGYFMFHSPRQVIMTNKKLEKYITDIIISTCMAIQNHWSGWTSGLFRALCFRTVMFWLVMSVTTFHIEIQFKAWRLLIMKSFHCISKVTIVIMYTTGNYFFIHHPENSNWSYRRVKQSRCKSEIVVSHII